MFLLLLLFISVQAQHAKRIEIGLQLGPNYTFLRGNKAVNQVKGEARIAGGAYLRYAVGKVFLRTAFLYENKSNKQEEVSLSYDADGNVVGETPYSLRQEFHYLTVPALLEVPLPLKGFHVLAGPYFSFLLGQDITAHGESLEYTSFYRRIDTGLSGGVSYYKPISAFFNLKAELRHNLGLLNINKDQEESAAVRTNATNLLLGVGYSF